MTEAVLLLGTNLHDRMQNLMTARKQIIERTGVIVSESKIYRTAPWGNTDQDDFLNMIVVIRTSLPAEKLLAELLDIEKEMGRVRTKKWEPRLIDLDILYFGEKIIDHPGLTIPHPFIQERRFALIPLTEVLPDYVHPVFHKTNSKLLSETTDTTEVFLYEHNH